MIYVSDLASPVWLGGYDDQQPIEYYWYNNSCRFDFEYFFDWEPDYSG